MNKSKLVGIISSKTGLNQKDAKVIVETILGGIREALVKGERLEIRGLGTFEVRRRAQRMGRNISTGERVQIPPKKVPVFIPGKVLKRLVNE